MDLQVVDEGDVFQCNICMGQPRNSVLTSCGHLFCWPCLHGWLQHEEKPCPVCKLMVKDRGIIPVYGCQRGSSTSSTVVHGALPPRPNAPAMEVGQQSSGSSHPNGVSVASYFNNALPTSHCQASVRDLRMESLRSRAQANFQAIRASHPSSPVDWIAEASDEFARGFDPLRTGLPEAEPIHDLHLFVFRVLISQGEVFPGVNDFRRSWLPYYEAQNPRLDTYDHYNDFVAAWSEHFHRAWYRAGRPGSSATNMTEAQVTSRLSRASNG